MSTSSPRNELKLDPWSASSLLQKAIRRGEVSLAQTAATAFQRFRGSGVWRRLISIAIEDVGIGDTALLYDLVRLGTDKSLRELLGSDNELISAFCSRLANAGKDRSTDYVYCAAIKLETAKIDKGRFADFPVEHLCDLACDPDEPLVRRAVAAMSATVVTGRKGDSISPQRLEALLLSLPARSSQVEEILIRVATAQFHPICLMLPLVWAQWWHLGAQSKVVPSGVPHSPFVSGVPLYTFDKHTLVGKRAIAILPQRSAEVGRVLSEQVPASRQAEVCLMAAYYADAVPVTKRLEWSASRSLEFIGMHADMISAGCPYEAVVPVTQCVCANVHHINELRRSIWQGWPR